MIIGTSACWASIMLTLTMPEKIGPMITYGSSSIAFCICERAKKQAMPTGRATSATGGLTDEKCRRVQYLVTQFRIELWRIIKPVGH